MPNSSKIYHYISDSVFQHIQQETNLDTLKKLSKISQQPHSLWLDHTPEKMNILAKALTSMSVIETLVIVLYDIPHRDVSGSYNTGGLQSSAEYLNWIKQISKILSNKSVIVIVEPDSLASIDLLSVDDRISRYELMSASSEIFSKNNQFARIYLDAGNPNWVEPKEMAQRLQQAGVSLAQGFAINVSNFVADTKCIDYGMQICSILPDKTFVVDSSRNGNGEDPLQKWCNPVGRKLGRDPVLFDDESRIDGYLWIKTPGQSDGSENGAPPAGKWYRDYAVGLCMN